MKKRIVALTGAGISAESGIKTFRDSNGLWEGHDVMQVASPEGFARNPALVLDFYNQRRRQLKEVVPNKAHQLLAELESDFNVTIITQNVDDLHERAGSSDIIHLHGELLKSQSVANEYETFDCQTDIHIGDLAPDGQQLRPHIVWFGEAVPMFPTAVTQIERADIVLIIGTSLQVYPAAGLVDYASHGTPMYYIDLHPSLKSNANLTVFAEKASVGMEKVVSLLKNQR